MQGPGPEEEVQSVLVLGEQRVELGPQEAEEAAERTQAECSRDLQTVLPRQEGPERTELMF